MAALVDPNAVESNPRAMRARIAATHFPQTTYGYVADLEGKDQRKIGSDAGLIRKRLPDSNLPAGIGI